MFDGVEDVNKKVALCFSGAMCLQGSKVVLTVYVCVYPLLLPKNMHSFCLYFILCKDGIYKLFILFIQEYTYLFI